MSKVITDIGKRWELGLDHHPKSEEVRKLMSKLGSGMDFGGDGDDGEELLYYLDIYFELEDERIK